MTQRLKGVWVRELGGALAENWSLATLLIGGPPNYLATYCTGWENG